MHDRFTPQDVETWHREGCAPIHNFFTPEEVAAVRADFVKVFGGSEKASDPLNKKHDGQVGRFHETQFLGIQPVPINCSPALNLIGVHPALMAFAKQALKSEDIYLYQCQSWAKFTGESDYDQPFHCDFVNHTLTVPSEDQALNSVTIMCYFSDVTEAHGPMHYVTRPDSLTVAGPDATFDKDPENHRRLQASLKPLGKSTASPAGSIAPYAIDVYHRGTNMTAPGGVRYAVMVCYRAASNDSIGFHAWPFHHTKPWENIFNHATPEQLACFGVQRPGHRFWTDETLRRAQARYPGWDLAPYRAALKAQVA